MNSDTSSSAPRRLGLSELIAQMEPELRCLLGPDIHLTTGRLQADAPAEVRARRDHLVDLLRHLALDARDAMPSGGTLVIRTGRLPDAAECAAIILHEVPAATPQTAEAATRRPRKGRGLGLNASYEIVERAGGHFHVSCRGRETVLTICFPRAA